MLRWWSLADHVMTLGGVKVYVNIQQSVRNISDESELQLVRTHGELSTDMHVQNIPLQYRCLQDVTLVKHW